MSVHHSESQIDFVVRKLREAMPRNWQHIADMSGVPYKTLVKVAYKSTKNPRYRTVEALNNYFVGLENGGKKNR